MGIFIAELASSIIDNPVTDSLQTKVEITLVKSTGRIYIENYGDFTRSIHRFTVENIDDLGYKEKNEISSNQVGIILAISCLMVNPRVIFDPLYPIFLSSPQLVLDKNKKRK